MLIQWDYQPTKSWVMCTTAHRETGFEETFHKEYRSDQKRVTASQTSIFFTCTIQIGGNLNGNRLNVDDNADAEVFVSMHHDNSDKILVAYLR